MPVSEVTRLMNKKAWTGEETGKAVIYGLIHDYTNIIEGNKGAKPLFTTEKLLAMFQGFRTSPNDIEAYNRYVELQNWVKQYQAVANAHLQRFQGCLNEFISIVKAAETAEDEYRYIERLPRILTQKQYEDIRARRIDETLSAKGEAPDSFMGLIFLAVGYYALQLETEPKKANPLKRVKMSYSHRPVRNKHLIAVWNENTENGYYQLPDGTRSDAMPEAEWAECLERYDPEVKRLLMDSEPGEDTDRTIKQARALHTGEAVPIAASHKELPTWYPYEEAPEGLCKWDIIVSHARGITPFREYYPSVSDDGATLEEKAKDAEAFKKEFPELLAAIFKAIDAKGIFYGEEMKRLSEIPAEEWGACSFNRKALYDACFPGFREWVESDANIFDGDNKALLNGIAILRPSDLFASAANGARKCFAIDGKGYFIDPETREGGRRSILFGLDRYTPANPKMKDNVEAVENSRKAIEESLTWLLGYDTAIQLIADEMGIEGFTIFQANCAKCLSKAKTVNGLYDVLYSEIRNIEYQNADVKAAKLEVLRTVFRPLKADEIAISDERKGMAASMLKDLEAFSAASIKAAPGWPFLTILTKAEGGSAE